MLSTNVSRTTLKGIEAAQREPLTGEEREGADGTYYAKKKKEKGKGKGACSSGQRQTGQRQRKRNETPNEEKERLGNNLRM